MASHHVLLLGGHGKVAQYLTPLLLRRSWTVTSIIRNQDQAQALKKLGEDQPGKLEVLVRSLEDVKSDSQAKSLIDEVKPDYIVWSAGAGGKGGPERVCT
jgi:nucleoside-diphosphate-sugar epimerase